MENSRNEVLPHPQFLEILFAFKNQVLTVFKEVLGLHQIHHIALTRINKNNQLITLSSTPAMEYNLFSGPLWHYDQTYNSQWYNLCTQSNWEHLYNEKRYDELYYLKQIKHKYPIGASLATKINESPVIYSLASHNSCAHTRELFSNYQEDFYSIGHHCLTMLDPLFNYYDDTTLKADPDY